MDKSGGNPSKSTKKGPTHGQDNTKNFIWTMVFINKWKKINIMAEVVITDCVRISITFFNLISR